MCGRGRLWALMMVMAIAGAGCAAAQPETPAASPAESAGSGAEWEQGFAALFNGHDLEGWHVMGAQSWSAQEGLLVCSGEGGGWIRSDRQYRDFVLRLEYRIAPGGSSGIFLRATEHGDPTFTGMEVQILDDFGREPTRHSAGAVYDAVAPAVNASRPAGEWNQVEITCWGDRLVVFMNGQQLMDVDLTDPDLNAAQREERKFTNRAQVGYIGLQNHGALVAFRNIRLSEGLVPIFNGRDLEGWQTVYPEDRSWSVADGALVCSGERGGYIYHHQQFGDFALRGDYRISGGGNSGIFFRVSDLHDFAGSGAEVQVLDSYGRESPGKSDAGAIYGVVAPAKNAARPAEEWNAFEITCWQGRLTVVLNGETVVEVGLEEYDKLQRLPARGYIGLQNHRSPVAFRDLRIKTPEWEPRIGAMFR